MSTNALRHPPAPLLVGAVVWLSSELLFFGTLFGAWFSLRSSSAGPWPPEGIEVDPALPALGTGLLLASSLTIHRAARAAGDGDRRSIRTWLLTTLVLGTTFLALQAWEWMELEFSVSDHAYTTAFYALTGFHGLHVLGGLLAMAALLPRVAAPRSAHDAVEVVSYYWHFVDVVWVALFATVYLAG